MRLSGLATFDLLALLVPTAAYSLESRVGIRRLGLTVGLQVTPSEPSAEAGGTSYSLALNVSTLKLRTATHVLLDRSKLADLTLSQLGAPSCVLSTFDALAMTELALQVTRTLFSSRIIHKFDRTHPYCAAVYF